MIGLKRGLSILICFMGIVFSAILKAEVPVPTNIKSNTSSSDQKQAEQPTHQVGGGFSSGNVSIEDYYKNETKPKHGPGYYVDPEETEDGKTEKKRGDEQAQEEQVTADHSLLNAQAPEVESFSYWKKLKEDRNKEKRIQQEEKVREKKMFEAPDF